MFGHERSMNVVKSSMSIACPMPLMLYLPLAPRPALKGSPPAWSLW